jgi:periplasmic protein TonB
MTESPEPAAVESMPDIANYYVHKDGVQYGPESEANLRALCEAGWLLRDDLVWQEGQPEWQDAGAIFASAFADAGPISQGTQMPANTDPEEDDFADGSAVRLSTEKSWPWGSMGIAVGMHIALLFLAVELLQLYPIKISEDATPVSQDPPLEVAMIPEAPPAPPPPPAPTPPPPDPTPPAPPPPSVADLPLPPPAPVEMPVQAPPPPPIAPVVPEPVAVTAPPPAPPVSHHKSIKPIVHPTTVPVAVPEAPPPSKSLGQPEYLANPRPEYPITARLRRQQGTVLLLVTLDEGGNPTNVSVEQSSGFQVLDLAAQKKVLAQWRFKPGQGLTVHVPVEFHLEE